MKKAIVIPTFWGNLNNNEEIPFDHPTFLNTEGTLKRLLDNLKNFDEIKEFKIYIVGISNKESLNEEVELYLQKYLKPFSKELDFKLVSNTFLLECINKLGDKNHLSYLFDFKGYSNVRNFSLIPLILDDIDIAIFLDDDEIIEDSNFFKKALEFINETIDYGKIYGKAGYYLNNNDYKLPIENIPPWRRDNWNKIIYMNETFEKLIESDERLLLTDIALGGNMVLTKEIMRNICYDINIPRGEDMDYILNAKIFDYLIVFDNKLKIAHLPPKHSSLEWKIARSDINRFKYTRQKINCLKNHKELKKIKVEEMMSYPGIFLKEDFEEKAENYMQLLGKHYLENDEIENYIQTEKNIYNLFNINYSDVDLIDEYKKQLIDWKIIISIFEKSVK